MKYYCEYCGTEIITQIDTFDEDSYVVCPGCDCHEPMNWFPDYETPAEYEKRTDKPWPDNGPVWTISDEECPQWHIVSYAEAKEMDKVNDTWFVCAHGPKAPDDDWRPE